MDCFDELTSSKKYIGGLISGIFISMAFVLIHRLTDSFQTVFFLMSYLIGLLFGLSAALKLKIHYDFPPEGLFREAFTRAVFAVIFMILPTIFEVWSNADSFMINNYMNLMLYLTGSVFALKSFLDFKIYRNEHKNLIAS